MCLGELGRVSDVLGRDSVTVEVGSRTMTASALTLDAVPVVGDWVLVHSGFVLARLTEAEAGDALELRRSAVREEL